MEFQVTFQFEAVSPREAHQQISRWKVTPGAILMHVTHNPPRVVHQPFVVHSGDVSEHIAPYEQSSAMPPPIIPQPGVTVQPFAAPAGPPLPAAPNGGTP